MYLISGTMCLIVAALIFLYIFDYSIIHGTVSDLQHFFLIGFIMFGISLYFYYQHGLKEKQGK